ncbi:MAG: BMC domain-containing protein [Clostridia bacterium]|nr:BMC domain-containing protein [Clostridia bacterium]MBR6795680.1 BMC domain-containing protein [Clostridia bacterium]
MYRTVGVIELKSIAKGIEACDAALKSAGVRLISAHPSCPGKYEIVLTGDIADVTAAIEHVKNRFDGGIIDASLMGRIDEQVIAALFGSQNAEKKGSVGVLETFSSSAAIKAADLAVKTAKVAIYDLRVSRGMGGKGIVILTGDVADVTAAVEAGAAYAAESGLFHSQSVIPAPHADLWEQL